MILDMFDASMRLGNDILLQFSYCMMILLENFSKVIEDCPVIKDSSDSTDDEYTLLLCVDSMHGADDFDCKERGPINARSGM